MTDRYVSTIQRLLDEQDIANAIATYARGVDRGDWNLLRSTYHPDAFDDHVEYKGDIPGLITWLKDRFRNIDNSTHFLGNSLIEFHSESLALVETYFVSHRVIRAARNGVCRQSWGRYLDRFEKREGLWKVAYRVVVIDSRVTSDISLQENPPCSNRGFRDDRDPLHQLRASFERSEI